MSDIRWAMIRPHEDRTVVFLDEERFAELAEDIANGESGVTEWLTEVPDERDPQYWPERTALLIKFEVLKPPAPSGGPTGGTPNG